MVMDGVQHHPGARYANGEIDPASAGLDAGSTNGGTLKVWKQASPEPTEPVRSSATLNWRR